MPLVDYANSDDEEESEDEQNDAVLIKRNAEKPKPLASENVPSKSAQNPTTDDDDSVFSALPKPRANPLLLMDDSSLSKLLLNKKLPVGKDSTPSGKVKISVPSVSEFSDSDPLKKKPKVDVKGSGLFSVLPPPKNNFEFNKKLVPHSVTSTQNKKFLSAKSNVINKYLKKTISAEPADDDDETPVGSSFFGSFLSDSNKVDIVEAHPTVGISVHDSVTPQLSTFSAGVHTTETFQPTHLTQESDEHNMSSSSGSNLSHHYEIQPGYSDHGSESVEPKEEGTAQGNPLELDEKALQILCGGKRKRDQMPMNIIDLSGEEIMPDSNEWLLKQLSEEKKVRSTSHRKSFGPSSQSRRKHQITYLAYQAKEQELELQNQWAQNRMSRRQTQSKYGF